MRREDCVLIAAAAVLIAGCGGGGGDGGGGVVPANSAPTANAGADVTAEQNTTVTLDGSASADSDGSIATYAWAQTAGTAVSLSAADQVTATFTAPAVAASEDLTFSLTVTDDDGASSTADTIVVTVVDALPGDVTISGKAQYEFVNRAAATNGGLDYGAIVERPIRGATVQAINASDSSVLATATTDENGDYALAVPAVTDVFIRVLAELKQAGAPSWDIEVRNNTENTGLALAQRPIYALDGAVASSGTAAATRDLLAASGWGGSSYTAVRAAAPFSVLDVFYAAVELVLSVDADAQFAPLDAFWSVNNCPTSGVAFNADTGEIGTSFYLPDSDSLFLLGCADDDTEEFDTHVIAHEWGHYFEDNFSRSDSVGGAHSGSQRLDMRLAFGEGWGNAIAGMILGDPRYRDSFGPAQSASFEIDVESNTATNAGWFNEFSIQSVIWDIFDDVDDGPDQLSLGFAPIYDIMIGPQRTTDALTSVFTFATAFKAANGGDAATVDALLTAQQINGPGTDDYGSNETNNAGNANDVLPIYADLIVGGGVTTVCATDAFDPGGDGNKLSIYRYLRLNIAAAGQYTISVQKAADPVVAEQSDPDFFVFRQGVPVIGATSGDADSEVGAGTLQAGEHIVELAEFAYQRPDLVNFPAPRVCFDVTAVQN